MTLLPLWLTVAGPVSGTVIALSSLEMLLTTIAPTFP